MIIEVAIFVILLVYTNIYFLIQSIILNINEENSVLTKT